MIQAAIAGALAGLLIGSAIGSAVKEASPKEVYTFGDPAAIVEQWEPQAERGR